jgi:hypothetical protein
LHGICDNCDASAGVVFRDAVASGAVPEQGRLMAILDMRSSATPGGRHIRRSAARKPMVESAIGKR